MVTTLGLISILLVLIIVFQIGRANDMLGILRGEEQAMDRSNTVNAGMFLLFLVVFMVGTFWSTYAYSDLFIMDPVSEHGVWIKNVFFWTLVATVPVFVATHIALFWFAFKYKRRKGETGYYYPENNRLELVWTVIPSIVLILLVYEGMRNWYAITGPVPEDETALVVEATGQQFQWILRYSGDDNKLGDKSISYINSENPLGQDWTDSANKDDFIAEELHLPIGKRVMVKINSMDVLHSFALAHFYVKMDAVPGIPT
ncbi:MAG: cytochrome c oxidase subunit II transmembrane domain-containing protein, partial [Chitinophagales bacterium]